jgi:hypothetical protein
MINKGRVPGPRMFVSWRYHNPGGGGELNLCRRCSARHAIGRCADSPKTQRRLPNFWTSGADQLKFIATGGGDWDRARLAELTGSPNARCG